MCSAIAPDFEDIKAVALHSLEAAVFISFCVLPSVTRSLFLAFQCESFGFDDPTSETKSYLTASLDIECTGPAHQPMCCVSGFGCRENAELLGGVLLMGPGEKIRYRCMDEEGDMLVDTDAILQPADYRRPLPPAPPPAAPAVAWPADL